MSYWEVHVHPLDKRTGTYDGKGSRDFTLRFEYEIDAHYYALNEGSDIGVAEVSRRDDDKVVALDSWRKSWS